MSRIAEGKNNLEWIRVWDPLVRVSHWVIVAGFGLCYITEGEPTWLHSYLGYAIAVALLVRFFWGFVGPKHARFASFAASPRRAFAYFRDLVTGRSHRHIGHSPAGGAMSIALFIALSLTTMSGMATLAADEGQGPLAPWFESTQVSLELPTRATGNGFPILIKNHQADDHYGESRHDESLWAEVHEAFFAFTLFLVLVHLCGVIIASVAHKENLLKSMVTGLKRAP